MIRPAHRRPLAWLLLLAGAALASACRGGLPPLGGGAATATGAPGEEAGLGPSGLDGTCLPPDVPRAEVALGAYAEDARARALAGRWDAVVRDASARLVSRTGLAFPSGTGPTVVLRPLGNESVPFRLAPEIVDGRRRARVEVNLEVLAAARAEPVALVAEGLAAAVYETTDARIGPVPAWVTAAATIAVGEGIEDVLLDLADRPDPPVVDPATGRDPEATGVAALLVLAGSGDAATARRFFRFVAEGDAPDPILARLVEDPLGTWQGEGRRRLERSLARIDPGPARVLANARRALEETGPVGLESALPAAIPPRIAAEIAVLRARAAGSEGDHARARQFYRQLTPADWGRLADPGAAMAAWLGAEERPGGDPALAARLAREFALDYPLAAARSARRPPDAGLDVVAARDRLERLLADARSGAARAELAALGDAALAPELETARRATARAEASPSPEAVAANRPRVARWLADPTDANARDVREGGAAAAVALSEVLAAHRVPSRATAVHLLAQTAEPGRVVALLAGGWARDPRQFARDLDTLLATVPYRELRIWVEGQAEAALARVDAEALWAGLRYGLDPDVVRVDPALLEELRSEEFAVRRAAFQRVLDAEEATPELVAKALADPAILLRREAALAAGRLGFRALLALALRDDAWAVRQAAVPGTASTYGPEANRMLVPLLAADPSPQVRIAAAAALDARGRPWVADALLDALDDPHPGVRRAVQGAVLELDPEEALPAIHRALLAERARAEPRPVVFAVLFGLFERLTGRSAGYYPGMQMAEVDALIQRTGTVAGKLLASTGRGPAR